MMSVKPIDKVMIAALPGPALAGLGRPAQRAPIEQILRLVEAITSTRDPYTASHQRRVTMLAGAISGELGLDDERVSAVLVSGLLHDIGHFAVPDDILFKPGRLTDYEMSIVKQHARAGHDILASVVFPWPVARIVLQHHERLDGSGYPDGLRGSEILPEARILAVADTVEAMLSHRLYRSALALEDVLAELLAGKGVLYDAETVEACISILTQSAFAFDEEY